MDGITSTQVGGDVDHEYCKHVTLTYLATLDEQQTTRTEP